MSQKQGRVFFEWLVMSAIGLAVGGFALALLGPVPADLNNPQIGFTVAWAFVGAAVGVALGLAQWIVLRRHLQITSLWILSAVVGWAIAMPIASMIETPVANQVGLAVFAIDGAVLGWFVVGAVAGTISSLLQSAILPLRGVQKIQWIFINALGWALALAVSWSAAVAALCIVVGPAGILSGLIGGAISGVALLQLLPEPTWQHPQPLPTPLATAPRFVDAQASLLDAALARTLIRLPNQCARIFYRSPYPTTIDCCTSEELQRMLEVLQSRLLRAVAGLSEEEMQWRPHKHARSALDILWHLSKTELPVIKPSSKREALTGFREANDVLLAYLIHSDLDERIAWWDGEDIPLWSAAWGAIRHRSYHLGDLTRLQHTMREMNALRSVD